MERECRTDGKDNNWKIRVEEKGHGKGKGGQARWDMGQTEKTYEELTGKE